MQTITVCGGTLFGVAASYLGDATAWQQIAQANSVQDPWLSGLVTLVVSGNNVSLSTGLGNG